MKYLFFLLYCFIAVGPASGQVPASFHLITPADFARPVSPVVDQQTTAVVTEKEGSIHFTVNKIPSFSYVHKYRARIQVLDRRALDVADIAIQLFGNDHRDELTDFRGTVYNLENGKVTSISIDKSAMYEDVRSKYWRLRKVALPGVKEGSIVDYSFTVTSPRFYDLPAWRFQDMNYPCLSSRFDVQIPDGVSYLVARYGVDSFDKQGHSVVKNSKYLFGDLTVISNDVKAWWSMKDVPAFKNEGFLYLADDYLDKIDFTIDRMDNGASVIDFHNNWSQVLETLLQDPFFGEAIDDGRTFNLKSVADNITSGITNKKEQAQKIYQYVRDNFICIPNSSIFLDQDLYEVNRQKKGNVAALNLLVIGLLRQKGIQADPVILSTRDFGRNSPEYPLIEKMNYVIAMTTALGDTIFLDASRRTLGFGQLPLDCYNGHARVVAEGGKSILFSSSNIREMQVTSIFASMGEKGRLEGSVETMYGPFKTEQLKSSIASTGEKKYFDDIRGAYSNELEISKEGIDGLRNAGEPARIYFEFATAFEGDVVYFNPTLLADYRFNPFKQELRRYPVSISFPIDHLFTLNMEIPEGYEVDEQPKPAKVSFNEDQGLFEYGLQVQGRRLQLRTRIQLKEVFFKPSEYEALRSYFAFIAAKYNEPIIFKKKK